MSKFTKLVILISADGERLCHIYTRSQFAKMLAKAEQAKFHAWDGEKQGRFALKNKKTAIVVMRQIGNSKM